MITYIAFCLLVYEHLDKLMKKEAAGN
jgi:hypothetical protein